MKIIKVEEVIRKIAKDLKFFVLRYRDYEKLIFEVLWLYARYFGVHPPYYEFKEGNTEYLYDVDHKTIVLPDPDNLWIIGITGDAPIRFKIVIGVFHEFVHYLIDIKKLKPKLPDDEEIRNNICKCVCCRRYHDKFWDHFVEEAYAHYITKLLANKLGFKYEVLNIGDPWDQQPILSYYKNV